MMDKETEYAYTRLDTMVRHQWPNTSYDSALLCADVGRVLAELAHLRTDLELTQAELAQTERALAAERVARMRADADNVALRQAIWSAHFDIHYRHKDSWTWEKCPKPTCYPLREALAADHPGAQLLAELEAARAFIHKIRIVPIIGGWTDEQSALLAAYDAARGET